MAVIAPRPPTRPPVRMSLTAAASRRSLAPGLAGLTIQEEGWQNRMWHFYDNLGCVHYGVQFKRNAASKVAFFAAELSDDKEEEPQPTANQTVIDAVDRLHSRFGDINEIVAEFMVHINVPGEGYLVGQDGLEGEEWDVWSVEEIRQSQFASLLQLQPDRAISDDGDYAARIWRPHPRNRHLADAPLRPVADQCEQLLLLEDSISAAAKSRLSAGLFYLPSELDVGDTDAFMDEVIAVLTTPIKDTSSAARWAPGLIRGPAEYFDRLGPISFSREIDVTFAGMREELTRSIAAGIDLPAEIILGKADLNHWTGWEIDESAFRDHIDPDIVLILDSITRGYLHPALVEGGMGIEEAETYLIWRDLSDLGQKPVTVPEAIELEAASIIGKRYVRDLIGATDEDAPEEPEPAPEPVIPELVPMPAPPGPPAQADQVIVAAVARGRPLTELSSIDRRLLDRITEASEAAFNRVLERAGAKIRSHAKKDRGISLSIDRLPNDQVTRHLGEALTRQLQITPSDLVPPDSFDPLTKRLRTIMDGAASEVEATLEALTGTRPTLNPRHIQGAIGHYTTQLESLSVKLLFNPLDPGPGEVGDSIIPPNMVMDMMTQASGGVPTGGPSDVRGFATGQESLQFLEQNGYVLTGHQWEYGDSSTRRRPFPPHRRLDGVEFTDWEDERLNTPSSASFLHVSHMFPGDHYLCQCRTVPVALQTEPVAATPRDPNLPDYVNARPDMFTLNMTDAPGLSQDQRATVQGAFSRLNQRFPGMLDDLQEVRTSPDLAHFAEKDNWRVTFQEAYVKDMDKVRQQWAGLHHEGGMPGCIATKAGGVANEVTYMHNVALHEFSHIGAGRFQQLATTAQRERLTELFTTMQKNRQNPLLENPFETMPSLYADENFFEFTAEALSDAVIGDHPSPTSLDVMRLFDEVFK